MKRQRIKRLKTLPKFRSRREEREFWETHDATEYFDEEGLIELAPHIKDVKLIHVYMAPDGSRWIMIPEDGRKRKVQITRKKFAFLASN